MSRTDLFPNPVSCTETGTGPRILNITRPLLELGCSSRTTERAWAFSQSILAPAETSPQSDCFFISISIFKKLEICPFSQGVYSKAREAGKYRCAPQHLKCAVLPSYPCSPCLSQHPCMQMGKGSGFPRRTELPAGPERRRRDAGAGCPHAEWLQPPCPRPASLLTSARFLVRRGVVIIPCSRLFGVSSAQHLIRGSAVTMNCSRWLACPAPFFL